MPHNPNQENSDMMEQAIAASKRVSVPESVPQREMPRYQSHKKVWALKIKEVEDTTPVNAESDGSALLHFDEGDYAPLRVDHNYVNKHKPQAGGYYVVYPDGYKSWSPAEAFEDGYTRI